MSDALRPLPPLRGEQRRASAPDAHVWLSASAGTGKTQVLSARVFRLLLRGVEPSAILCLTFTKAGAAEMAARVSQRLAAWVRMKPGALFEDLRALGEPGDPVQQDRARTLFAKVLDAPGGGLRIQTIHGFCQGLLAAFPAEANLVPGFRPIEPREEAVLARATLAELLVTAEREGRAGPVEAIGRLSVRLGETAAEGFLHQCARAGRALEALPSGIQPWLRGELGLPSGDIEAIIAEGCDAVDLDAVERVVAANRGWGTATGIKHAEAVSGWVALERAARAAALHVLRSVFHTGRGEPRKASAKLIAAEPDYELLAGAIGDHCAELLSLRDRAAYADLLADALTVGRDYARAYAAAKRRGGLVDFDDLIAATVDLLEIPGIGEWVRFKLDQTTEHVLIDEAQDTNVAQWRIVRALVDEYFVGRGVYAPSVRTLFTVGDHKQAIFGFQGTDPINFRAAEMHFARKAADVQGDDRMPDHERGLPFEQLSLVSSFRSTRPVLQFVDAAILGLGPDALGLDGETPAHASEVAGAGFVELWPPIAAGAAEDDGGAEEWIDDAVRANATRIARQVRQWLDAGTMLESKGRPIRPEDIMILVKRRGEIAQLLVARLYAEGVPVAGVDRLRLNAPLAVQDLLAAIRFVLQPDDDLSLASLLVSPLIGWTQDELLARAVPRRVSLWRHLSEAHRDLLGPLDAMLARADFTTPYRFLEELLSGALDGRRKLLSRLGEEARDPIEELLSAALDFETTATPSLQRFLDWFDRGEVEVKREAEGAHNAVRVMTAHGAKGLQAPVVILADATADPDATRSATLMWTPDGHAAPIPVFAPRAAERAGPIEDVVTAAAKREKQEHWRLFYVAATRAEERLVIAGSLGPRYRNGAPEASWHAAAARALDSLGVAGEGARVFRGDPLPAAVERTRAKVAPAVPAVAVPEWVRRPAPPEARPPRPLAPSSIGDDAVADPPPTPAMRAAAERGRLIHGLFERLPGIAPAERAAAADRWLAKVGQVSDGGERRVLTQTVCDILADPRFAELFGAGSLGEAPISAVIEGGLVIAGTVDRLLVTAERVQLVDFKTGRQASAGIDDVPEYHVRQMAAYAAALAVIFPDRPIEAALLYTAGPVLIALPPALLAAHKPGFAAREQSLAPSR
ncbi:double-strand break repair helicase AddA [Sphingomonas radiodurans]|uniref:double-strand break repair helicase AddA n=1 Tax=Sphingomonas radiodurans TaxID=2890321 RepID=UPI001E3CC95A|nr:double-strand break repair helicase AddA [Sphingomonas radiodurans]WBH16614.1 double-strand break repair helicase AddA [Sphingomonas radiodurans]